jgi:hypothetical protein
MDSTGWAVAAALLADNVRFKIFWATLGLVGALLAFAVIVSLLERWRKRSGLEGMSAGDQLTHFRELRDKGSITEEEYERIRAQLTEILRREMNLPQTPVTGVEEKLTLPQAPATGVQEKPTLPDAPPPPEAPPPG